MLIPKKLAQQTQIMSFPTEIFELIHNFSMFLIKDDKHDIGQFIYYDRDSHYYHGKHSPDHPTAFHHWQIGLMGLVISQLGSLISKGSEMYSDYKKIENGDMSEIDPEIMNIMNDNNTISLDDYKQETSDIPEQNIDQLHSESVCQKSSISAPELPNLIGLF